MWRGVHKLCLCIAYDYNLERELFPANKLPVMKKEIYLGKYMSDKMS